MRPFRANAADLSFEKYWGVKGYVSAQLFYKYFDTFVVDQNLFGTTFDYCSFPIPTVSRRPIQSNLNTYLPPEGITTASSPGRTTSRAARCTASSSVRRCRSVS